MTRKGTQRSERPLIRYKNGCSDETIAKELGLSKTQVARFRREVYGVLRAPRARLSEPCSVAEPEPRRTRA
jgi:transcriptional regulator with XRE-family HTH domain